MDRGCSKGGQKSCGRDVFENVIMARMAEAVYRSLGPMASALCKGSSSKWFRRPCGSRSTVIWDLGKRASNIIYL
jgi:hypothetical protein